MADSMNANAIKLNAIKDYVKANVKLQCSQLAAPRLAIQGAPGTGKSDIIREICEENGWTLSVKYLSNMSLEQITGIPCKVENGSTAIWSKPELFNFDMPEYATDEYLNGDETVKNSIPKILLIDDFHLADRIMQRYLFQLLTYKSLNGYKLPENTAILLAGNRNTDKALANPIPAPVCNRLMFMEVKSDCMDWLNNFAIKNNVRGDITSFLYREGDVYLSGEPLESGAWASPRAWTYLGYQMDAYEQSFGSIPLDALRHMANGLLGPEYATKFIEYRELFAKWDFDKLSKMGIDSAKKEFTPAIKNNPTDVYAIISAGNAWLFSKYRDASYNSEADSVVKATRFLYDCFTFMLTFPDGTIRRNTRPMIIAGIKNIHMFNDVTQKNTKLAGKKPVTLLRSFLTCMKEEKDVDFIFWELLMNIFEVKLSPEEIAAIEKAKANLKYEL